jgi:hypothetical protein
MNDQNFEQDYNFKSKTRYPEDHEYNIRFFRLYGVPMAFVYPYPCETIYFVSNELYEQCIQHLLNNYSNEYNIHNFKSNNVLQNDSFYSFCCYIENGIDSNSLEYVFDSGVKINSLDYFKNMIVMHLPLGEFHLGNDNNYYIKEWCQNCQRFYDLEDIFINISPEIMDCVYNYKKLSDKLMLCKTCVEGNSNYSQTDIRSIKKVVEFYFSTLSTING